MWTRCPIAPCVPVLVFDDSDPNYNLVLQYAFNAFKAFPTINQLHTSVVHLFCLPRFLTLRINSILGVCIRSY